jgi:Golgi phosphoprotein 3
MLTLSEELFLLTLSEKKSSVAVSSAKALPVALIGAMLAELMVIGKIALEDGAKVKLASASHTENEYFNHILLRIEKAKKPKKLTHWLEAFSRKPKKLEKSLVNSLIAKKVLKEKKKKLLWVIPFLDYSQADASAKFWRKRQIRAIILAGEKVDPQSAALLNLLKSCNLLDYLFTKDEMHLARKRAAELIEDPSLTKAFIAISDQVAAACAKVIETGELT